jgi:hypothetical protein
MSAKVFKEKAAHEATKEELGKRLLEQARISTQLQLERNRMEALVSGKVEELNALKEENRILAITGAKREDDAFNEGYYQETISELRAALEKIADPRKRDHKEPDAQTEVYCLMHIANEALGKGEK